MEGTCGTESFPTSLVPSETNGKKLRIGTRSQMRLHARWWAVRDHIITAFESSDEPSLLKRAERLDGCCASPLVHGASNGKVSLVLQCCRDRLCPRCQRSRGLESARRITELVKGWNSCRFATLTLKHTGATLSSELDRLHASFRSLRKERLWKERVSEGVWSVEVTRNTSRQSWHVHVHLLYQGEFFPQKQLSDLWLKITSDSQIVDIRAVPDREKTARYIAEYVSKPLDAERWSHEEICEYAEAMHGRRLIHTFGKAHGTKVDEPEIEEKHEATEFVAPLRPLIAAADNNDREAKHAIEILCRISRTYAEAAGEIPRAAHAVMPPVEDWEHAIVLREARRAFSDLIARSEGRDNAAAPPPRPVKTRQAVLFDGPRIS